jgi:hypothetical protein
MAVREERLIQNRLPATTALFVNQEPAAPSSATSEPSTKHKGSMSSIYADGGPVDDTRAVDDTCGEVFKYPSLLWRHRASSKCARKDAQKTALQDLTLTMDVQRPMAKPTAGLKACVTNANTVPVRHIPTEMTSTDDPSPVTAYTNTNTDELRVDGNFGTRAGISVSNTERRFVPEAEHIPYVSRASDAPIISETLAESSSRKHDKPSTPVVTTTRRQSKDCIGDTAAQIRHRPKRAAKSSLGSNTRVMRVSTRGPCASCDQPCEV